MPYTIRRKGNRYQVINKDTGKVYSTTTKVKAERQLRLLQQIERNYTEGEDGTFTRTVKGRKVKLHVKS